MYLAMKRLNRGFKHFFSHRIYCTGEQSTVTLFLNENVYRLSTPTAIVVIFCERRIKKQFNVTV